MDKFEITQMQLQMYLILSITFVCLMVIYVYIILLGLYNHWVLLLNGNKFVNLNFFEKQRLKKMIEFELNNKYKNENDCHMIHGS